MPGIRDILPGRPKIPYGKELWEAIRNYPHDFLNKWNTIIEVAEIRCNWSWRLFVETALPAVGEAALALVAFDWDDIARGALRPYGIRGRYRIRKGGTKRTTGRRTLTKRRASRILRRAEIPEIGELIGKNLPGSKLIKSSAAMGKTRWLWILDGFAQRFLFYWLIFDVASDFLYNWAMGIAHSRLCARGSEGARIIRSEDWTGVNHNDWQTLAHPVSHITYRNEWGAYLGTESYGIGHPAYRVRYIWTCRLDKYILQPPSKWEAGLFDVATGGMVDHVSGLGRGDWAVLTIDVSPGQRVVGRIRINDPTPYAYFRATLDTTAFIQ